MPAARNSPITLREANEREFTDTTPVCSMVGLGTVLFDAVAILREGSGIGAANDGVRLRLTFSNSPTPSRAIDPSNNTVLQSSVVTAVAANAGVATLAPTSRPAAKLRVRPSASLAVLRVRFIDRSPLQWMFCQSSHASFRPEAVIV